MTKGKTNYSNLYSELECCEKKGVCILIDGDYASPMQVVRKMMAKEDGSYMRDYEMNSAGRVESLSFVNINKKKERKPV